VAKRSTLLAILFLCFGVGACGGTSTAPHTATSASNAASSSALASAGKDTNDLDDDASGDDDRGVLEFGHAATPSEQRPMVTLLKRYYAAAAAADGRTACPMIYSIVAEAATEEYGRAPALPALRGKTCAVVMSKLFRRSRRSLRVKLATLKVTDVRVEGDRALVVMSFATTPEPRKIPLHREAGRWKVQELLDSGMP
jgi:hypothetical protein